MSELPDTLSFLNPHPDKAYVGRQLWLPKRHIHVNQVKAPLEFWSAGMEQELVRMWEETEHHLIVPREFLDPKNYDKWPFTFVDVSPTSYPRVNFKSNIKPRDDVQHEAMQAMLKSPGGILNLSCGKGKTVIALWLAAQLQVPFLVVVNNTSLIQQWEERIQEHLQFTGKIGRIQRDTFNWEQPCALAMIHTLAFHADTWPAEFQRHWGLIFYDEIHHLAAPLFSRTAPLFYGRRYGLTATQFREDGRERVYYFHVGRSFYSDLEQDLEPRIYFVRIPTKMDLNDPDVVNEVTDITGEVHLSKLRVWMGKQESRNDIIATHIRKMLRAGRKVLALTHSVDQLDRMQMRFPDESATIWSGVNQAERMNVLRNNQLIFATSQLAYEGLDEPSLDSLVLMTPFGSRNWVQQSIGRIQREREGKKQPVVSIFEDYDISKCVSVCLKAKRSLRRLGMDYQIVR